MRGITGSAGSRTGAQAPVAFRKERAGGGYNFGPAIVAAGAQDRRMLAQFDAGCSHRRGKCLGEIPGVETRFIELHKLPAIRVNPRRATEKLGFAQSSRIARRFVQALHRGPGTDGDRFL